VIYLANFNRRIRQFLQAIGSNPVPAELLTVRQYLNQTERDLFYNMVPAIQKHSINTALTILNMPAEKTGINKSLLIKAALLHDTAKIRGSIYLWDRVSYVLLKKLFPKLLQYLASPGHGSFLARFRQALYIHLHHPEIGARIAEKAGLDKNLVYLIKHHHDAVRAWGSKELAILMEADEAN
jgi:putative nucleotidyltransferase with HDIG domain